MNDFYPADPDTKKSTLIEKQLNNNFGIEFAKKKELESLIEKKFNNSLNKHEEAVMKQEEDENNKYEYDDEEENDVPAFMNKEDETDDSSSKSSSAHNELKINEEYEPVQQDTLKSIATNENIHKIEDHDLKALNDFIRANSNFDFGKLSSRLLGGNKMETSYENIYARTESENAENIRSIVELCRIKFPDLKYKISKNVKSAFKEKFRGAFKTSAANKPNDSKAFKASVSQRSVTFKSPEIKNEPQFNMAASPAAKVGKKHKLSITCSNGDGGEEATGAKLPKTNVNNTSSASSNSSISSNSSASTPSLYSYNSPLFASSPASLTNANLFAASSSSASSSTNEALASQLFETDFFRLAATNPLFRFSEFASLAAANNPYLKNFSNYFRSQNYLNPPGLANNSTYDLKGNSLQGSGVTTATAAASTPLSLSVSSLTNTIPSNTTTAAPQQYSLNSKKSPSSKSNQQYHHSSNVSSHQTDKSIGHSIPNEVSKTQASQGGHKTANSVSNGESNGLKAANVTNGINSYFSTSSKLKLSSKFSKLSSSEIQTIKSLINGYKESAAFLSRSAEELESLINDSSENE